MVGRIHPYSTVTVPELSPLDSPLMHYYHDYVVTLLRLLPLLSAVVYMCV